MFKLVAMARILVSQGGEAMGGGPKGWSWWEKMRQGLGQREHCEVAGSQ